MTRGFISNDAESMAPFTCELVHQSARFFIGQVRSLTPALANHGPLVFRQVAQGCCDAGPPESKT